MPLTLASAPASTAHEVDGKGIFVYFIPKDIVDSTSSVPKHIGILCTLDEMSEIPISPQIEREIMGLGKVNSTIRSKEIKLDPWTLTIKGGDPKTLALLLGQDPNSATMRSPQVRGNYGISGHLLIRVMTMTGNFAGDWLIHNIEARLPSIPAASPDSSFTYQIEFQSTTAKVNFSQAGEAFAIEGWKTPNTAAPDGTITAFTLGTGNGSYASATTPVALSLDSTLTGFKRYFTAIYHNGTEVNTAAATFNAGTSVLTFGTAPATGTLLAFYLISTASINPPNFDSGYPTTNPVDAAFGWQDYA